MPRNKSKNIDSLLENIKNIDILPSHVVVSAIQGLSHYQRLDWKTVLLPLLDYHDKIIAGSVLSVLCIHSLATKYCNQIGL